MRVAIGADHAGFALKTELAAWLQSRGVDCRDVGADSHDAGDDYVPYAAAVARAVAGGEADRGVAICGTGVGSCIVANKVPGVRAVVCSDTFSARVSRQHNDANVLCLGERVVGVGLARELLEVWLGTAFSGDARHRRRIQQIAALEAPTRGDR
jgi:ribose 5-phosphate isomerase B